MIRRIGTDSAPARNSGHFAVKSVIFSPSFLHSTWKVLIGFPRMRACLRDRSNIKWNSGFALPNTEFCDRLPVGTAARAYHWNFIALSGFLWINTVDTPSIHHFFRSHYSAIYLRDKSTAILHDYHKCHYSLHNNVTRVPRATDWKWIGTISFALLYLSLPSASKICKKATNKLPVNGHQWTVKNTKRCLFAHINRSSSE